MPVRRYNVSADHQVAQYACQDSPCSVSLDRFDKTWSASMPGYGCGKNFRTPEDAIVGLLQDHACYNIRFTFLSETEW